LSVLPPAEPISSPGRTKGVTVAVLDSPIKHVLPRYAAVGALSVAVDLSLLTVLHSVAHVALIAATSISFGAALVVNYSLNHVWAFDAAGLSWHRFSRYGVLVVINFGLTLALVSGLTRVGVYYLVAKALAVGIGAAINFTGYRSWVFNNPSPTSGAIRAGH
jgi:putative flippase GtrA